MDDDLISFIDVASYHGKRRQTIFKILKRLRIEPVKRRNQSSKNQLVAYITQDDFRRVSVELQELANRADGEQGEGEESDDFISAEAGVFYLIQLEPECDPGRFKVGFAASLPERLRVFRCVAP